MASRASLTAPAPASRRRPARAWHALTAHPLRAAMLGASLWALGTLLVTGLGLVVQVREHGWKGAEAPALLVPALAFAAASYLLRFLRWHLLARRVAPGLPLGTSFVVGAIGFALVMTPARSGEALKLLLLRRRAGVPVATSAPVLVLEKGCEAAALAFLALAASAFLPWTEQLLAERRLALLAALLLGLALGVTFWRPLARLLQRLPLARRLLARPGAAHLWSDLLAGGDRLLTWSVLARALGLSLVARLCDGLAISWVAGLYGVDLSLAAAWFTIGSSGFLGGVSMVPGGAGVVEGAQVGLLLAFGAGPAAAVATALTARLLIFWLWVALGLGLALRDAAAPWHAEAGCRPPLHEEVVA